MHFFGTLLQYQCVPINEFVQDNGPTNGNNAATDMGAANESIQVIWWCNYIC